MNDLLADVDSDLKHGRPDLAASKCRTFLQNNPDNGLVHTELARSLFRSEMHDEAAGAAQAAIALNPHLSLPYGILGHSELRHRRFPEAEEYFKKALDLDPRDAVSRYYLGQTYLSQEKATEAIDQFEQAIAVNPKDAASHFGAGIAYLQSSRWQDSVSELIAAFRLSRRLTVLVYGLTMIPLIGLARYHFAWRVVIILLLHFPLVAPLLLSVPYWLIGEAYLVWLIIVLFKNRSVPAALFLTGFIAWWTLAPWLFRVAQKLVLLLWGR